jgi:Domain of unknown function (DUF1707)
MSDELEIRVSDAEREQAVARLRKASTDGRLTLDELAARTGWAYGAQTRGELVQVTRDLPAAPTESAPVRKQRPRFVVAVFAPVFRRHRWRLGRRTFVFSLFAPTFFDLGAAVVEGELATITVLSIFAPVNVTVPAGLDLETSMLAIFAPVRDRGDPGPLTPGSPRIRVNGLSIFAPVFVKHRRS